jgi:hypothetical protein
MKNKQTVLTLVLMAAIAVSACSQQKDSGKSIFGKYPANYEIAYLNMFGYSKSPTINELFGPERIFTTTFEGVPSKITLESTSTREYGFGDYQFIAVLLLTIKKADTDENVNLFRVQIRFRSDSIYEKSYIQYIKFDNLISGESIEQKSYGVGLEEEGQLMGFFTGGSTGSGILGWIWNTSRFQ